MLSVVCKDVRKEPTLSTTTYSNDELRADISVRSFSKKIAKYICSCKSLLSFAPSYRNQSLATAMKTVEN